MFHIQSLSVLAVAVLMAYMPVKLLEETAVIQYSVPLRLLGAVEVAHTK